MEKTTPDATQTEQTPRQATSAGYRLAGETLKAGSFTDQKQQMLLLDLPSRMAVHPHDLAILYKRTTTTTQNPTATVVVNIPRSPVGGVRRVAVTVVASFAGGGRTGSVSGGRQLQLGRKPPRLFLCVDVDLPHNGAELADKERDGSSGRNEEGAPERG